DRDMTAASRIIGYIPITSAAREYGQNGDHERLYTSITIQEAGYVYLYLSNENPTPAEVYFDDFKVEHIKSPIIQMQDYYPFGLTFNDYERENSVPNKYLYNKGSERQDDLGLNVYQTHFRFLDPAIGRWWQVDPKTDQQYDLSAYNSMNNNPILYNDPLGDIIDIQFRKGFLGLGKKVTVTYTNGILTNPDRSVYTGKVKGFLKQVVNGLNKARTGGTSGNQLVTDLQNGARFTITNTGGGNKTNTNGSGIKWNPSNTASQQPNGNGTTGRPAWIGLIHELGHQWDIQQNGQVNIKGPRSSWYVAGNGERVTNSDKIATWWENRIRTENGIGLRENYSFMASPTGGNLTPDPAGGQIVNPGTRTSTVVDSSGHIYPGSTLPAGTTPYTY
ncbi:MAG TPA: RHS repeat-associated core domain-containing protein, partial [Cyclobacteriaceae bacterium]